jgi:hypothetical protein
VGEKRRGGIGSAGVNFSDSHYVIKREKIRERTISEGRCFSGGVKMAPV